MKDNESFLKEERERLLLAMQECEPGSAGYDDLLKELRDVSDIDRRDEENAVNKRRDTLNFTAKVISAGAGVGTFLLLLKQEVTGSFTSKGMSWITDFIRKSN